MTAGVDRPERLSAAMWLDESCIHLHMFASRAVAAGFLKASLAGGLNDEADALAHCQVAKRRRLADGIEHADRGGGLTLPEFEGAADVSSAELMSLQGRHLLNMLDATPLVASTRAAPSGMYA